MKLNKVLYEKVKSSLQHKTVSRKLAFVFYYSYNVNVHGDIGESQKSKYY